MVWALIWSSSCTTFGCNISCVGFYHSCINLLSTVLWWYVWAKITYCALYACGITSARITHSRSSRTLRSSWVYSYERWLFLSITCCLSTLELFWGAVYQITCWVIYWVVLRISITWYTRIMILLLRGWSSCACSLLLIYEDAAHQICVVNWIFIKSTHGCLFLFFTNLWKLNIYFLVHSWMCIKELIWFIDSQY